MGKKKKIGIALLCSILVLCILVAAIPFLLLCYSNLREYVDTKYELDNPYINSGLRGRPRRSKTPAFHFGSRRSGTYPEIIVNTHLPTKAVQSLPISQVRQAHGKEKQSIGCKNIWIILR